MANVHAKQNTIQKIRNVNVSIKQNNGLLNTIGVCQFVVSMNSGSTQPVSVNLLLLEVFVESVQNIANMMRSMTDAFA